MARFIPMQPAPQGSGVLQLLAEQVRNAGRGSAGPQGPSATDIASGLMQMGKIDIGNKPSGPTDIRPPAGARPMPGATPTGGQGNAQMLARALMRGGTF